MADINQLYERELRRRIGIVNRRIRRAYEEAIDEISIAAEKVVFKGQVFSLDQYPRLKKKFESVLNRLHSTIYVTTVNSIKDSWSLSNKKNNLLVDRRLARRRPNPRVRQILYDPNRNGLQAFLQRKEKGLNLSDRVWKAVKRYHDELEAGVGLGIADGVAAKTLAKDLKQYLNQPDKLFRRVRDEKGRLRLSKPAEAYHPGRGVYRSSYKNALRLTRTETNIAYRTADHERWQNLPFVVGIEVKLSASHPKFDICDHLKGEYPKDFKFTGWHPQCLCYQVPKIMNDEEYSKLEDSILGIAEFDPTSVNQVTEPPPGFNEFVSENRERINGWKNKPYWVRDNQQYFDMASLDTVPLDNLKLVASGKPVAPQFTKISESIKKHVKHALNAIDSVHGDGKLEDIPFERVSASYEAAFFQRAGSPLKIHLSSTARSPALSLAHEMGHYFDLHAIGKKGRFESDDPDSLVGTVIEIAKDTRAIKKIYKLRDSKTIMYAGEKIAVSDGLRQHFNYLLSPKEIWARAYSQFIAQRSGSKLMLKGLKQMRNYNGIPYHWTRKDFEPIEKAIAKLMYKIRWIKSL